MIAIIRFELGLIASILLSIVVLDLDIERMAIGFLIVNLGYFGRIVQQNARL